MVVKNIKSLLKRSYIKINEKTYNCDNIELKYLCKKENSDMLIVVFSAMSNDFAQYNYIKALSNVKANKLFILDNFGPDNKSSYYLGSDNDFFIENICISLVEKFKHDLGIKKVIFLGSSKGGYASLYLGIKYGVDFVIAGAPQYKLGFYLNTDWHRKILEYIKGDSSEKSVKELDNLLKETIINSDKKPNIYLHYSNKEHTYNEHIKYLIEDLEREKYILDKDECSYNVHEEVGSYFPIYFKKIINGLVRN